MQRVDHISIIESVLESERREVAIFRRLSERIATPLVRAVFTDYAEKSRAVCRNLEGLKSRLAGTGETGGTPPCDYTARVATVADFDDEAYLSASLDKALADLDDLKAINMASRFVRRTAKIIAESLKSLNDPGYWETLKAVEAVERENFMHLKNIEEYLKDPHSWFREREHHMLDGG